MRNRIASITFVAALLALPAPHALAEQTVTFSVPVHLSQLLPEANKFKVVCSVQNRMRNPNVWENHSVTVPISNGKYDGVVHVQVSVPEERIPKSKYWACRLYLLDSNGPPTCDLSVNASLDQCKVKPGAALVTTVSGALHVMRGRTTPVLHRGIRIK